MMKTKFSFAIFFSLFFGLICFTFLFLSLNTQPAEAMERMTDAQLREVTGRAGFIESEEELKKFKSARNDFKNLIQNQGLEKFLPKQNRQKLFGNANLKPEAEAKLIQRTTRNLLRNRDFLKRIEKTGRTLAKLAQTFKQIRSLR